MQLVYSTWLISHQKRFLKDKKVEMLKLSHPNDYIDDFCIETESTIQRESTGANETKRNIS